TLLDVALGTAARLSAARPVVTLDMQTRFLAPGRDVLLAEGRVTRAGRSVIFCEAEIRDVQGELVASATGLLKPVGESGRR
ncbi:PaaI family thioesterase, partial [Acinetobacter baumannii]|nr:PaaI family thioesterase [Acinetobacter baumannii]